MYINKLNGVLRAWNILNGDYFILNSNNIKCFFCLASRGVKEQKGIKVQYK